MTHFIAYHNADQEGDIQKGERCRFRSSNRSRLEASIGQTVWIIQGKKPETGKGRKIFTLRGKFRPDSEPQELNDEKGNCIITGQREFSFEPPLVLNGLEWFDWLFAEQSNFSFGFNRISDPRIIVELENCVANYTRHEITMKEHRGKFPPSMSSIRMRAKTQQLSRIKWAHQ